MRALPETLSRHRAFWYNAQTMVAEPHGDQAPPTSGRRGLLAICVLFVLMALAYNLIIPPHYGPDEIRHERYYQYVYEAWQLPADEASTGAIVHHPPLYYLICLPFWALFSLLGIASDRFMRLVSTALGLVVILITFRLIHRLFARTAPESATCFALLGAASVAFLPHFLLISSVVSNDVGAAVWGALVLYMAVSIAQDGLTLKRAIVAGLFLGLGCFTKASAAALGLMLIPALAVGAWRTPGAETDTVPAKRFDTELFLKSGFVILVAWLVAGGWWLVSFFLRFGRLDSDPPWPLSAWPDPRLSARILRGFTGLFRSAWTQVDWFPPASRWPLYTALALVSVLSAIGLILLVRRTCRAGFPREAWALALPLFGAVVLHASVWFTAIYVHPGRFEGGRYWLPAVAAYMGLWLPGLSGSLGRRWKTGAVCGLALLLLSNALSYYWLIAYLNPTYAPK